MKRAESTSLCHRCMALILNVLILTLPTARNVYAQTARCGSLKPSPATWMADLAVCLSDKRLNEVLIPGSHDAGSFSSDLTWPVRTQDLTLGQQLEAGIRYFDLRISVINEEFYLHHNGVTSFNHQKLIPQLDEIKAFTLKNRDEIIILDVRDEWLCDGPDICDDEGDKDRMSQENKAELENWFKAIFEDGIRLPNDTSAETTIGALQAGSRTILINWPGRFCNVIYRIYDDRLGSMSTIATFGARMQWIEEGYPLKLNTADTTKINVTMPVIHSPIIFSTTIDILYPRLMDWLVQWHYDPSTKRGLNVIAFDFPNHGDLVRVMMEMNQGIKTMTFKNSAPYVVWYEVRYQDPGQAQQQRWTSPEMGNGQQGSFQLTDDRTIISVRMDYKDLFTWKTIKTITYNKPAKQVPSVFTLSGPRFSVPSLTTSDH